MQRLTYYFSEYRIQQGNAETQLAEKDFAEEEGEEEQKIQNEADIAEKKSNFEPQNPLVGVNLGTDKEPKVIKISGLLPKGSRDQLVQLIRRY